MVNLLFLYFFLSPGKVFIANRDSDSIITSAIKPPIDIPRFIRLVPIIWTGFMCLRMELYGCPYGMSSIIITIIISIIINTIIIYTHS